VIGAVHGWLNNSETFVNAVSQDLKKARISHFVCKECVVPGLCPSILNLKNLLFSEKIKIA